MIKKIILIQLISIASILSVFSQNNPRYLSYTMVNISYRSAQIAEINAAADLGFNAILISIRRDVISEKRVDSSNPWRQYDDQIATARNRGMKIYLKVVMVQWCSYASVASNNGDNNIATCTGYGANERMLGYNNKGIARIQQQSVGYAGCDLLDDCGHLISTSLASQRTVQEMQDFTKQVLTHYKAVIDAGDVISISVAMNPEHELGFPTVSTKDSDFPASVLYDYSEVMINGFRDWLKTRYSNDFNKLKSVWGSYANSFSGFNVLEPPKPNQNAAFNWGVFLSGPAGEDWFFYRHKVLKDYSKSFVKVIKEFNPKIKVVNDYGAVNDNASYLRGTFAFKNLGEGTDGIKTNCSPTQDVKYISDLLRTTFSDRLFMIEVEAYQDRVDIQERQIEEAFTHGATLVSGFNFNLLGNQLHRDMFKRVSTKFIAGKQQVQKVETCGTLSTDIHYLLVDGGCNFTNKEGDCRFYKEWLNLKANNGNKPVKVFNDEGWLTDVPFKLAHADLSSCGSIPNFTEIYSSDCQKLGNKPKAKDELKGLIENVSCESISGWALNTKNLDEIQTIDIYVDSIKIGTTQANVGNHPELVTTFGNTKANFRGFSFTLPDSAWYKSGQSKRIYARFANTSTTLDEGNDLKVLNCDGRGSGICGATYRLIVSPDSLPNVLSKATEYKIAVSTNTKWQIKSMPNWLTTSTDTGRYNSEFTLKITANVDTGSRKGIITLTAGNLSRNIKINQIGVGKPYISTSPDSITTVSSNGFSFKINTSSNVRLRLSKNVSWIILDPEVNIDNGFFNLKVEQNLETVTRKGKVTVSGQGVSKVFYITQKGKGEPCSNCNGQIDTEKPTTDPNSTNGRTAPPTNIGWVESITCCSVRGWAFDNKNYDENLSLDFYFDKQKIGSTVANIGYRADLAEIYKNTKLLYKSFCFKIPKSTLDSFGNGNRKQLIVRFGGTVTKLYSPEQSFIYCTPTINCPEGQNCEEEVQTDYLEIVFPNPSKDKFNLLVYSIKSQTATLKLVDSFGNLTKVANYDLLRGLNNLELFTETINNGTYLLSIALENGNHLFKKLLKVSE
jgi:hypothetical protein